MINGQALGHVSDMRYGLCPMSFNGCEVISVYNTLAYLGKPLPLPEISLYMERSRSLMGIFGCFPFSMGKALRHFGVRMPAHAIFGRCGSQALSSVSGRAEFLCPRFIRFSA